jgi:phosphomethylpyrimidine synthase
MKISAEVREFARQNPPPSGERNHPREGGDGGGGAAMAEAEAEAGMAEMSERYRAGGDLYVPAAE